MNEITSWNLLSIDFAHDEVEDFGLDNSMHTLLVKCMIQDYEDAEKEAKMVRNYTNIEKKAVSLTPKVSAFRDLLKVTLVEGWSNILRFRKLCRCD